ncbi:hypothetical protein GRF59_20215 [Paenibacillus sp. HJL G12]|uniref:DUF3298 domain-containing protein n=1 Tax=Paenibacillus dendrobii TaxID=2691084 RepID=A0A7X3IM84_9BACL|nr:hypothetical protein [Paenibacillus dendrobii]MWV45946.1 hypothetical protein [Paenibacillus dendrobii]
MQKWIAIGIFGILLLGGAGAVCAKMQQTQPLHAPAEHVLQSSCADGELPNSRKTAETDFEVGSKTVHRTHFSAAYPQLKGLTSGFPEEMINQDLENIIRKYSEDMTADDTLKVTYEVTRSSGEFYSFVFHGTLTQGMQNGTGGESFPLLEALNYDAGTKIKVTVENLVKHDKESMSAFGKLFSAYAGNNAEAFGDGMGVYFTDNDVVFYFLKNDAALEYTQVHVPLKEAKPYFNTPIQPLE